MKALILISGLLALSFPASAQASLTPKKITEQQFRKHLPLISNVAKCHCKKMNGMLKIRTAKGPVTFADDPEFVKYGCLGYIRNTKLRVIYQSEPYSEVCYLVDTVSARTDTFVSKLWFYTDKASFACLESKPSDRPQVIQVGQLANGSIKNKKNYTLSGDITPNQIFWADKNTLFIADGKAHYWKVNL